MRGRLKLAQYGLTLALFLVPLVSFAVAAYLRFATHLLPRYSSDAEPSSYFGLLLLTTILWALITEHYELNSIETQLLAKATAGRVFLACVLTYVAVLSITFFYRGTTFSRLFIWLSCFNLYVLTLFVQLVFSRFWGRTENNGKRTFQILMIGADSFARRVAGSLVADRVTTCRIKGYVRLPGQHCDLEGTSLYELSDIDRLAIGNGIDDVVVAVPPERFGDLPGIRKQLAPICAPIRLALDLGENVERRQRLFTFGDLLMIDLQSTPAESFLYIILKRAFDLCFSAVALVLAAPLFVLIAIAIRLSSPGPVIFVQERVGLNGKLFRMLKFRTMSMSSADESDTRWTVRNDPRCTRIGKFLRQTGLDELPQFFNVLRGEMSVVGPRPERPVLVQRFMQSVGNYNRRHYLKVGITGWAQVNGWRGDTSIEKRIEYDLYYVGHWTLLFDLRIVLLTLLRGFTDKNAY